MNWHEKMSQEIELYRTALKGSNPEQAVFHLGRAHILSQLSVSAHLMVHWHMFNYALLSLDAKEIAGQVLRLVVTVPGHVLGRVPWGNTGWTSVDLTKPMAIPEDLKVYFTGLVK